MRRQHGQLSRVAEDVNALKLGQRKLDASLDAIEAHQRTTDRTLTGLEDDIDALTRASGFTGPAASSADAKRAEAYAKAQRVDAVLNSTAHTLEELVERVNLENKQQEDDPLEQIRSILDSQMSALRYIDSEAQQLVTIAQGVAQDLQSRGQQLLSDSRRA